MGILLGLATALSWGSADLFARFATRRIGAFRTMLYMQTCGFCLVTLAMPRLGGWGHLFDGSGWQPWAWGILAGAINTFAMLALYRSFEIGKLSLVGPVSASYPALTVVLSLFSGERLTLYRSIGILAALLGVFLVATGEKAGGAPNSAAKSKGIAGLGWAIAASLSFGFLFWLLGLRMIPQTGALATVWLIRVTGTVLTFVVLLAQKIPL